VSERETPPHWAERLARVMDDGLRIPGTSFGLGLDAIVGFLFPGAGDVLTGLVGLSLLWLGFKRGVSGVLLARMALNIAIDVLVGAVPVLGDVFDVVWKSNRRNLALLERHQTRRQPRPRDYVVVALAALAIVLAVCLPLLLLGLAVHWLAGHF
jgi:hypothetical protein